MHRPGHSRRLSSKKLELRGRLPCRVFALSSLSPAASVKMIDHSLLYPKLIDAEMESGCELAKAYGVATACVKPCFVEQAAGILRDCTVVVFLESKLQGGMRTREHLLRVRGLRVM